jgi:hypothetical protein
MSFSWNSKETFEKISQIKTKIGTLPELNVVLRATDIQLDV